MKNILNAFAVLIICASVNIGAAEISVSETESPLVPMLAMNGRPSRERLSSWLAEYRKAGISKFLVYGRSGCEIEYMSEEWLDTCEFLVREAAAKNMRVFLYDEFDWPSGTVKKTRNAR